MTTSRNLRLTLLRHGETDQNKEKRFIGITDASLNVRGKEQAHTTARYLVKQNWSFDLMYCSPLKRCQETAEIVASYIPIPINITSLLKERNYGVFENNNDNTLYQTHPDLLARYKVHKPFIRLPQGESALDVEQRIRTLLWDNLHPQLLSTNQSLNILLVTHLNPIRAILHLLSLVDWGVYFRSFHNASITRIETNLKESTLTTFDYSCFEDNVCND